MKKSKIYLIVAGVISVITAVVIAVKHRHKRIPEFDEIWQRTPDVNEIWQ